MRILNSLRLHWKQTLLAASSVSVGGFYLNERKNNRELAIQPFRYAIMNAQEPVEPPKPVEEASLQAETETAAQLDQEKFLPEIPNFAQYLIVGGGTAAMSAFKAIRARDPTARVNFKSIK